jgi:hypothetical protein
VGPETAAVRFQCMTGFRLEDTDMRTPTLRGLALAGTVAGFGGLALAVAPQTANAQYYYPYYSYYPACASPYGNPYYCNYGYYPDYVWLGGGWGWRGGHWRGGYGGWHGGRFAGGGRFAMAHPGGGHFGGGHFGGGGHHR